jgi:hypothetical protein
MGFLKKLFGGQGSAAQDHGVYVYVKLARSGEIVRLRIDPAHELNLDEDTGGYISRKLIVGPRSYQRAEAAFQFNEAKHLLDADIDGGEMTTEEEWRAQEDQGGA